MGGMLHPTAKGIVIGRIAGLISPDHIVKYTLKKDTKGIEIPKYYTLTGFDYYIGFGTGYEQGQKLRNLLKKDTSNLLTFNQKIDCLSFLLEKQDDCRENLTQSYLDNIKYWGESIVPFSIIEDVQILLNENKIQKAVDKLFLYYKDHFHLKSLKEFYEIRQKLKDLRVEEKTNKKYNIIADLQKIRAEMQSWISDIKDKSTTHNI